MTAYTREDLREDWEFKIVRSTTGAFKSPAVLQEMLQEEAMAGWELVEKFDDNRVRLKRSAQSRRKDQLLPPGIDPYRTRYGMSEGQLAMIVMGAIAALALAGVLVTFLFAN